MPFAQLNPDTNVVRVKYNNKFNHDPFLQRKSYLIFYTVFRQILSIPEALNKA
jgi:hypothetical protein